MHHSSPDLAVCFHAVGMILLMFVMAYIYHQSCPSAKAVNSLCAAVTGLGMVTKLGPKTGSRVKEGQRVVAVPWPTAGGEGTYQQYVATPEKDLVNLCAKTTRISHLLLLHALSWLLQVVVPDNVDDDMAAQFLVRQFDSQVPALQRWYQLDYCLSQKLCIGCLLAVFLASVAVDRLSQLVTESVFESIYVSQQAQPLQCRSTQ